MDIKTTSCPRCEGPIRVTVTPGPSDGQANSPDSHVVCLDFHDKCLEGSCPLYGLPGIVMGVRLARSGLRPAEEWETVHGVCDGCGNAVEMEVFDETFASCPVCGTTNKWQVLDVEDEGPIAVMERGVSGGRRTALLTPVSVAEPRSHLAAGPQHDLFPLARLGEVPHCSPRAFR